MAFTQEDWLPSYEELTVPEITMSAAPMRAAAHQMGRFCDGQCKEFMLCMQEEKDPRKCLNEGKEVTRCGLEFLHKVKKTCAPEFTKYWTCLDHSEGDMKMARCIESQEVFDKCILNNFGQERPESGYFSRVRVHNTNRPRPKPDLNLPEPTPDPPNPKEVPLPDSKKLGSRIVGFPHI